MSTSLAVRWDRLVVAWPHGLGVRQEASVSAAGPLCHPQLACGRMGGWYFVLARAATRTDQAPAMASSSTSAPEPVSEDEMLDEEVQQGGKRRRNADGSATMAAPEFPALSAQEASGGKVEMRRIPVPPHRYTPLRKDWMQLYTPIVEQLKLDIRMNPRKRCVELKTSQHTDDIDVLQKAADFLKAYMLGFAAADCVAILRVEDLYVESFQVTDVKMLKGDHLARAIGRIAGKDGKAKYAIENATRTRIVLAENKVHILGSFARIKVARDAVCNLVLGSPISKVQTNLRTLSSRLSQRM